MEAACADVKRVTLELGGKSPMIVFEVNNIFTKEFDKR